MTRDHGSWSVSLGRWGGIELRVHIFLVLFAVFTLFLGWRLSPDQTSTNMMIAGAAIGILIASLLAHEVGHLQAAAGYGGGTDQIVLGPVGMSTFYIPRHAKAELMVFLAGPAVNAIICLACAGLILGFGTRLDLTSLFNPINPGPGIFTSDSSLLTGVKLAFWINWVLILVNLLPVFPFDGIHVLQAGVALAWPDVTRSDISLKVSRFATFAAIILCVAAFFVDGPESNRGIVPTWFALVILGVFLFFSAQREERRSMVSVDELEDDDVFGYDFSAGYSSLERSEPQAVASKQPGIFSRWLAERKAAKLERQREIEVEEDLQLDDLLGRLHQQGMQGLSEEERKLLQRISARLRERRNG